MVRTSWAVIAGLMLVFPGATPAAETKLDGTWRVTFFSPNQAQKLWFVSFNTSDGKLTGKVAFTPEGIRPATLEDVSLTGDRLRFALRVQQQNITFEGKVTEGTKKIYGSLDLNQVVPALLERTPVINPKDTFEFNKQILTGQAECPEVFDAAVTLLSLAGRKGSKPGEVRGWAAKAFKAAESYGPRWQRQLGLRVTEALLNEENFAPIALEYARRTERLLENSDPVAEQTRVLSALASALRKTGKRDEVKEVDQRLAKLEGQSPFKVAPFAGRKGKSDRAILVELFTGAECPPCVAADVGFDAVQKAYKPTDVVLLQYHLHVPGPDPLTNPGSEARQKYYGDNTVEGTPTILFNGKVGPAAGGLLAAAKEAFDQFREVIDPLLEQPAKVRLKASVVRKGPTIEITAEASELQQPGEKVRLRLALVEESVRFKGGNGQSLHHCVVRALPGGADGLALKEKTGKQSASVNLDELRKELTKYLDKVAAESPFPRAERPLAFNQLHVVAFVQNDQTKEVLQAVQVEVPAAAGAGE